MIRIRATVHRGFYRCGRHFGRGWQEFPDDAFSAAELEVLKAEPMLVVEQVDDPPAKAKGKTKKDAPPAPKEKAPEVMAEPQTQPQAEGKEKPKGKGK